MEIGGDLRQAQRNELYKLVEGNLHIDAGEFRWGKVDGEWVSEGWDDTPAILHPGTQSYFAITLLPMDMAPRSRYEMTGTFGISYSPGKESTFEQQRWISWDHVRTEVLPWIGRIREDRGPDLWELAARERRLLTVGGEDAATNTPFTPSERQRLKADLDGVLTEVRRTQRLSGAQDAKLLAAVEELKRAAERLGRKEWLTLLYGSAITLVITAAFAPDQAQHFLRIAVHAVQWLFQGPAALPVPHPNLLP